MEISTRRVRYYRRHHAPRDAILARSVRSTINSATGMNGTDGASFAYEPVIRIAQLPGDRARLAVADRSAIAFRRRDDLGSRACQEALIGNVDIVAGQRDLFDPNARVLGYIDDGVARDAPQNARVHRWRPQHAILDQEHVVGRALRNLPLVVEHQRLKATGQRPFDLGKDVVEIVERLDAWIERVRMIADRRDGADLHAVLVQLRRIEADVVHDDDDLWIAGLAWIDRSE